jgi:hypothetical protein
VPAPPCGHSFCIQPPAPASNRLELLANVDALIGSLADS